MNPYRQSMARVPALPQRMRWPRLRDCYDPRIIMIGYLVAVFGAIAAGCLGYRPPEVPSYCRDERAYTGALLLCVERSTTLEQSKACRVEVNKTCGITETTTGGRQ